MTRSAPRQAPDAWPPWVALHLTFLFPSPISKSLGVPPSIGRRNKHRVRPHSNNTPLSPPLRMDKPLHPRSQPLRQTLYLLVGWRFKIHLVDFITMRIKALEKSLGTGHRWHHNLHQHRCRLKSRHKRNNLLRLHLVLLPQIARRPWPPNTVMGLSRRHLTRNSRTSMEMSEQGTHGLSRSRGPPSSWNQHRPRSHLYFVLLFCTEATLTRLPRVRVQHRFLHLPKHPSLLILILTKFQISSQNTNQSRIV